MSERNMRAGAWRPPRRPRRLGPSSGTSEASTQPRNAEPTPRSFFRDHPGAAITFGALALASIGIVHQFVFLSKFDIQFFEYATAANFLVAAGKILDIAYFAEKQEYILYGVAFTGFTILWIIIACWYFSIYRTERIENNTKLKIYYNSETFIRGLKKSFFAYILVTWIGLLSLSADTAATRAEWIKSGKMGSVIVNLKASLGRLPSHETPNSQVQFITATGQYVFLYEMNSTSRVRHHVSDPRRVHVVSKDSIASIERMARPSGD